MWRAMGWTCEPKTERGIAVLGLCPCVEEHGLVEKYKCNEYVGGPPKSQEMEAQMEVAQQRLRVG